MPLDEYSRLLQLRREVDTLGFQIATNRHLAGELADHIAGLERDRSEALAEANSIARRLAALPTPVQSIPRAV